MNSIRIGLALCLVAAAASAPSCTRRSRSPAGCDECLLGVHANLTLAKCETVQALNDCLHNCLPDVNAQVSLALLADIYYTIKVEGCSTLWCINPAERCLDDIVVRDGGLLSTSLRCEDKDAFYASNECLGFASSSPSGCPLNYGAAGTTFLQLGVGYLCDATKRCYSNGNVYESTDAADQFVQYSIGDPNRLYTRPCAPGTVFKPQACLCE